MKVKFFNRERTITSYIQLDTRKCKACWKCLEECINRVIGKIDLPWHKHAVVDEPAACTGCLNCISICPNDAFSLFSGSKHETEKQKKGILGRFLINNLLLVSGLVIIISGLALQFGFHRGGPRGYHGGFHESHFESMAYEQMRGIDTDKIVWGFNYYDWSAIHKFCIVLFSLMMIYHIYIHWKWYIGIVRKHLLGKNIQVITLTILFLLVALTGLIPWFIDLSGRESILRLLFIEIHDKLTFILIVYFILHIIKRYKWYIAAYRKLRV